MVRILPWQQFNDGVSDCPIADAIADPMTLENMVRILPWQQFNHGVSDCRRHCSQSQVDSVHWDVRASESKDKDDSIRCQ
jgi:hypothetical protein